MFTCIACTKTVSDDGDDGGGGGAGGGGGGDGGAAAARSGAPGTKDAVKSLTSQIKDMALKFSGAYKQCKPCTSSSTYRTRQQASRDSDISIMMTSLNYHGGGSSSSTPTWDLNDPSFRRQFAGDRISGVESMSALSCDVTLEDENEPKEWMAQVEPGVHITFLSLPREGNELKRIRFNRELFNKWQAQRWWLENYERIMELYNVQRFNRQALNTPSRSEDERDSSYSRIGSTRGSPLPPPFTPRSYYRTHGGSRGYFPSDTMDQGSSSQQCFASSSNAHAYEAARATTSSRDDQSVSISNASDLDAEMIEEVESGIYITIKLYANGTKELRRVKFSRDKFDDDRAKQWWDANKEHIAEFLQ